MSKDTEPQGNAIEGLVTELNEWADSLKRDKEDSPGGRTLRKAATALETMERELDHEKKAHLSTCMGLHKAEEAQKQIDALLEVAQGLKDVVNAADGNDPYNKEELADEFAPLLGELYEAGVRLRGEL